MVEPFQLVFEAHLLGTDEAQTRVTNLDILLSGTDLNLAAQIDGLVIEQAIFDDNRRRLRVYLNRLRINHSRAVLSRKPETAITRDNPSGLMSSIAFGTEHPILCPISDAGDEGYLPGGEIFQLLTLDAIDAQIATHPKIATPILKNLKDAVIVETIVGCIVQKLSVPESD